MRRLQGVDAYLWYNETPANHMHTLKIVVLDTTRSTVPYSAEQFVSTLNDRLHRVPSYRWRLIDTPFGLHHPVWVDDPEFDISRHVHRCTANAPGGAREMDEAIGTIASTPLLRDRPLWELHFVEGLANGRVAVVAKIHHAMADGGAAANQLMTVADRVGEEHVPPPIESWQPRPLPSRSRLVAAALTAHPRQARNLPNLIGKTWRGQRAAKRYWRVETAPRVRPWTAPRIFVNSPIDGRRTFATTSIPLPDVQALRTNTDYTLNDIVLAIITQALRRLLSDRGELPDVPLVANVPAATGQRLERLHGNSVGLLYAGLPVHLSDTTDRLNFIHDCVRAARKGHQLAGQELLDDWLEYIPPKPFAWAMRFYAKSKVLARRPPLMNIGASNVRGPATALSVCGHPVAEFYSVGPLDVGMALNITVWSYANNLKVSVLSCPRQLPDSHIVVDAMYEAFEELRAEMTADAARSRSPESTTG